MRAGDIRCPECGKGFADVAPDYELDPGEVGLGFAVSEIYGHCEGDHALRVRVTRIPARLEVECLGKRRKP